ncbi:DNA sulfur modification protein DndD, partial [Salmonella enterica subsp. enterica serovar Newport]|nr:DNA sulfur modification protein DndD [Salmonella enterica subsp. enterica serovar Newport]
ELVEIEHNIEKNNIAVNKARQAVRNAGAHLIEKRDELKFELGIIDSRLKQNRAEQIKLAAGVGPLGLVKDLIENTKAQIHLETRATQAKVLDKAISIYNEKIVNTLKKASAPNETISYVNQMMAKEEQTRQELVNTECFLNTELSIFDGLDERIIQEEVHRQQLKKEEAQLGEQQVTLQMQLDAVPDYESVQHLISELARHEVMFKESLILLNNKQGLLEQVMSKRNILSQRYA